MSHYPPQCVDAHDDAGFVQVGACWQRLRPAGTLSSNSQQRSTSTVIKTSDAARTAENWRHARYSELEINERFMPHLPAEQKHQTRGRNSRRSWRDPPAQHELLIVGERLRHVDREREDRQHEHRDQNPFTSGRERGQTRQIRARRFQVVRAEEEPREGDEPVNRRA